MWPEPERTNFTGPPKRPDPRKTDFGGANVVFAGGEVVDRDRHLPEVELDARDLHGALGQAVLR